MQRDDVQWLSVLQCHGAGGRIRVDDKIDIEYILLSMSSIAESCSEEEVQALVHAFYAKVRQDEVLAPIFESHVSDWDHHLGKLVDFWSSILRRTGRFTGAPMPKHAALPGLDESLFQRWLGLFRETAAGMPNQVMAEQACEAAERIAQSLWMGYQASRDPMALPAGLHLRPRVDREG